MHIINDGSNDKLFTVDGVPYRKGLYEVYYNQEMDATIVTVGIRDIYSKYSIVSPTLPQDYTINGTAGTAGDIVGLVDKLSITLGFNTGGGGGNVGDFVPYAGMNILAGDRMKEGFLLANYDILSELPPDNSIAVGMSQLMGGFSYQGTAKSGDTQFANSFNIAPTSFQESLTVVGPDVTSTGNFGFGTTNTLFNIASSTGTFNGSSQFTSNVNAANKNSYIRIGTDGTDFSTGDGYHYELGISEAGYRFTNLKSATNDPTYSKNIVSTGDGFIAMEDKYFRIADVGVVNSSNSVSGTVTMRRTNDIVELYADIVISPAGYDENNGMATLPAGFGITSQFSDTLIITAQSKELAPNTPYKACTVYFQGNTLYFLEPMSTEGNPMSIEIRTQYTIL